MRSWTSAVPSVDEKLESAPSSIRLYISRILPIIKMGNYTALPSEEGESTWGLTQLALSN